MKILLPVIALLALVAGCSTAVSGSGSGPTRATTPATTPSGTTPSEATPSGTTSGEATTTALPLPTIDESAPARFCQDAFPGALGKPMLAVVVETPSGRLTCDRAAAVLVDYYAERRDPITGLPPLVVAGLTCNQVPEPALPQVVCSDGDDLVYSMWPQT
ncbi:hypothetical protein ACIGNX_12875 [Actinosynnema sp. NPDC053489]|uniref:hypothetical protein n=1 Tax=Actinosynnema sp. NPDC053489 TaxID=3363916 RepID=UPI0037C879CF